MAGAVLIHAWFAGHGQATKPAAKTGRAREATRQIKTRPEHGNVGNSEADACEKLGMAVHEVADDGVV